MNNKSKDVAVFIPCFMDQFSPETSLNMVKILERLNCNVHVLTSSYCCGQPAYNAGFFYDAKEVGLKMLYSLNKWEGPVIIPSGSCTGYIRNSYPQIFKKQADKKNAKEKAAQVFEFTEFLVDVLKVELPKELYAPYTVTYHDACGALRFCKVEAAPRILLNQIDGVELIEMDEAKTCCGFGGTFTVKFSEIAAGMAENKAQSALKTSTDYMVSTDTSCFLHLQSYFNKKDYSIKTIHIIDFIAKAWNITT